MIYLIGGAPRCGKTILAKRIAKDLNVSWISADALESIVKQYTPSEDCAKLFPKDLMREKTNSSNDIMYSNYSADEIFNAYITQSKTTWSAISILIEQIIQNEETIIMEGHQIHPQLISELIKKLGEQNIRATILTKLDVNQIVETARKSQSNNDWLIKKTTNPKIHYKIAKMLSLYSNYLSEEAQKYEITEISYNGDFEDQLKIAQESLLRGSRKSMDSWNDKRSWAKLLAGENCPMCADINLEENKHSFLIKKLEYTYVRLPKNQYDYGWVIVAYKKHAIELYDLNTEELCGFMAEVSKVAKVVSEEFNAVKIYYSIFGALCPHLHVHIIPKKKSNDPHGPVELNKNFKALPEHEYKKLITNLKKRLEID